ncbi:MAG: CDGSH iron-sulfur domain-containing protein [Rhodobiaceae bacterium]|nr:CDGSH iron-sulfur domain-containing protein [Rhodobiaceae bacterium]MCC0057022.1 CDGSH iron-sulfur domain-containing protein [Rhodobiaceae bacterium]
MSEEPAIRVEDREELIYMLAEAAAIEHNVMCCYLYAIWSLKRGERDGLTAEQAKVVQEWKQALTEVAIEEMTHLTLVGNLSCAIGAAPHLSRPDFPIPFGYHPEGIDLELFGFSRDLIDHAIFLERPEGIELDDAPEFVPPAHYHRSAHKGTVMPRAQEYRTIGHLYRGIYHAFEVLSEKLGEANLFCGDVEDQIGPSDAPLPGLSTVTSLKSAHAAIETIVEQGEGAPEHSEESHYQRFLEVREQFDRLTAEDPAFEPAFPVARNPVMDPPVNPENRVWIRHPEAVKVLDLANALYNLMLRFLVQSYGRDGGSTEHRAVFVTMARQLMAVMSPVCEYLASLPADPALPGVNAGISFTMIRDISRLPEGKGEMRMLAERLSELAAQSARLFPQGHELSGTTGMLTAMASALAVDDQARSNKKDPPKPVDVPTAKAGGAANVVEGEDLILSFDTKRCIHARFCVLGAPKVFLAGVEGDWLFPDEMEALDLRSVCHNCPSGAITYEPKGDLPGEPAPLVNVVKTREHGPYEFRGTLRIEGEKSGYRATLCRCGASKNKPFCDGSHNAIKFRATGEPETRQSDKLAVRDGPLQISPQKDGPLQIKGNLEICSGTGRNVDRVTGAFFCRCGGSNNKPFCDGTHKKIGFKS